MDVPPLDAPSFTLRQLAHLSAIVDAGSISGAAAAVHVSASALAGSLDELERALGTRLCVRRKAHGITLTADGARVVPAARALLAAAGDLGGSVGRSDIGALRGVLRIGCYRTIAPAVLPRLIETMSVQHPSLRVEVADGDGAALQGRVASGELDAAVLYDRDVVGELDVDRLRELVPYVLLAADHPRAGHDPVRLADLADDPLVLLDIPPSRGHTMELFARYGVVPRVRHRTGSFELTRSMVGLGLGYAVLVHRPRSADTDAGAPVTVVELTPAAPSVGMVLVRARGRDDPRVAAAVACLRADPRSATAT